jgi:hypothetical protein
MGNFALRNWGDCFLFWGCERKSFVGHLFGLYAVPSPPEADSVPLLSRSLSAGELFSAFIVEEIEAKLISVQELPFKYFF